MAATLQVGNKVRVVGCGSGHDVSLNTILTVKSVRDGKVHVNEVGCWFSTTDLTSVNLVLSDFEDRLKELQETSSYLNEAIDWMKSTENVKVSVKDFKAYLICKIVNSTVLTHGQKIEKVCQIIDNPRIEESFKFELRTGTKVVIVGNRSRHSRSVGSFATFDTHEGAEFFGYCRLQDLRDRFHIDDIAKADITYKDFSTKLHIIEKEIAEITSNINWMKENGLTECSSRAPEISTIIKTLEAMPEKEKNAKNKIILEKLIKEMRLPAYSSERIF